MKFIFLLALMFFGSPAFSQVQAINPDVIESWSGSRNYIRNPSARSNTRFVTVSNGTLTRDTDVGDNIDGVASWLCDTSAAGGFCMFQTATITAPDTTGNCEARITYKGDASTHTLRVTASGPLLIEIPLRNSSEWTEEVLPYPCGTARDVRVVQPNAGDAPAINIGRVYWGKTTSIGQFAAVSELQSYTPTFTGFGTVTNVNFQWRRVGSFIEIIGGFTAGTTTAVNGTWTLPPGLTTPSNIPAHGAATLMWLGYTGNSAVTTTQIGWGIQANSNLVRSVAQDASNSNLQTINASSFLGTGASTNLSVRIPIAGWSASQSAAAASQADYGYTNFTPVSPQGLGTLTVGNAADCGHWRNGEMLLVSCKFTTGTTAASAARFALPNGLTISAVKTPTIKPVGSWVRNNSTANVAKRGTILATGGNTFVEFSYDHSQNATNPFVAQLANSIIATGDLINVAFEVPISGWEPNQRAPTLIGSVTSNSVGAEAIERVFFGGATEPSACTASPCTTYRRSAGISSVTRTGAGNYSINFVSGLYSAVPTCVFIQNGFSGAGWTARLNGGTFSTTRYDIVTVNSGGAPSDSAVEVMCMGPR